MKGFRNVIRKLADRSIGLAMTLGFGLLSGLAVAADYQVVDLGANVSPKDINSDRVIAGARNTDQYPNIAFRWTPGFGFEDLNGTSANAINDAGYAVGSRRRYGLAGSSAIVIAPPYNSVNSGADVTYLPTGGVANAINDQNLIVGTSSASC